MEDHEISEDEIMSVDALTMETSIVALASKIYIRGDVYLQCRGNNACHADVFSTKSASASNRKQTSLQFQYVEAVITYPGQYPTQISQIYSIFAEIEYSASRESEQTFFELLELNLESIRAAGMYNVHETNRPLMKDLSELGDDISIITFTNGA